MKSDSSPNMGKVEHLTGSPIRLPKMVMVFIPIFKFAGLWNSKPFSSWEP